MLALLSVTEQHNSINRTIQQFKNKRQIEKHLLKKYKCFGFNLTQLNWQKKDIFTFYSFQATKKYFCFKITK